MKPTVEPLPKNRYGEKSPHPRERRYEKEQ